MSPRIGALFAGYGGLDLAVTEVFGGEMAWYSEIDRGALKILEHRFPDVPNVGSVTEADWSQVEPVDILTGGSPCQDLSHAGRRAGMTEGTRSNLWVAMREAIAQLRPSVVVWENVRGAASAEATSAVEHCAGCMGDPRQPGASLRALGRVVGDLSDLGYVGQVRGVRAADVGATHGRFRYFLAAANADGGFDLSSFARSDQWAVPHGDGRGATSALLPTPSCSDTNGAGAHGDGGLDLRTAVALLPTPAAMDGAGVMSPAARAASGAGYGPALRDIPHLLPTPRATRGGSGTETMYAAGGERIDDERPQGTLVLRAEAQWGDYAPAIARWEHALGRPAPAPTMTSTKGNPQLAPAFVEWMMGLPAGWVTDVPGITRNEALKALGNGVVPQQAAAALRTMLAWEVAT